MSNKENQPQVSAQSQKLNELVIMLNIMDDICTSIEANANAVVFVNSAVANKLKAIAATLRLNVNCCLDLTSELKEANNEDTKTNTKSSGS